MILALFMIKHQTLFDTGLNFCLALTWHSNPTNINYITVQSEEELVNF